MNVLVYRYGSICEPDIISGFETLGFKVSQITNEITNKNLTWSESTKIVSEFLLNHPHDFVFSINFFPQLSEVCNIFHMDCRLAGYGTIYCSNQKLMESRFYF